MNYSTAVFLINDKVRVVKVSYEPDKKDSSSWYAFKTFDHSIVVGDMVVIPTDTRHLMTVARVEDVNVDTDDFLNFTGDLKWIIGKVDMPLYRSCIEMEQEAIRTIKSAEKRKKKEELRKSILADLEEKDLVALPLYSAS